MITSLFVYSNPTRRHLYNSLLRIYARSYSEFSKPAPDHSASSKLFEDAAREEAAEKEAEARANRLEALYAQSQNQNWTGEESMQDAVLRMLVDKYKPLRSGPIRSAEEKLKQSPPRVASASTPPTEAVEEETAVFISSSQNVFPSGSGRDMANVPLIPAVEGHQPWDTTFRVPSHVTSHVKHGNIPPPPPPRVSTAAPQIDEKARKQERDMRKRTEQGLRLSKARESTIDYRLGLKGPDPQPRRPNPISMKGWANLVEERIEKARLQGQFNNIQGRGKPLSALTAEKNPFIAREEFLMNRIVQRQGAAPPWVEIQRELESAVASFRGILKESWTRRAIRMLTISHPAELLPKLTLAQVRSFRDAEWEAKERGYHDTALEEINSLVRRYNGLAPYAVRRAYYMRNVELQKVYEDSAEDILRGIIERANAPATGLKGSATSFDEEAASGGGPGGDLSPMRFWDMMKDWFSGFAKRTSS